MRRSHEFHLIVGMLACIWLVSSSGLEAQSYRADPLFGVWFGGELVPDALDRTCASGDGGAVVFGGSFAVPVGLVGIVARVSSHWRPRTNCGLAMPSEPEPGIYESRRSDLPGGNFTSLDLRVAREVASDGTWVASAGVGWAASSKDVPYLTASFGVRSRVRTSRLGVDLEVSGYRVPWTERTVEVTVDSASGETTTIQLSERHFKDWATTVGLRLTLEIPIAGRR